MSERSWTDDCWVRVMCDYSAGGLWTKAGLAVWPSDLPASDEIRARIEKWQEWFEDRAPEGGDDFDTVAFSAEGLAIAEAIKAELPHWTVIYYDEAKSEHRPDAAPREFYEYEVRA